MCTGVVQADDWGRLRVVAQQLNGRSNADAHELERTAIRLSNYIAAGTIEITFTNDIFGVGFGSEWLVIDFKDGLEDVCIPAGGVDHGANAPVRKVVEVVLEERAVVPV